MKKSLLIVALCSAGVYVALHVDRQYTDSLDTYRSFDMSGGAPLLRRTAKNSNAPVPPGFEAAASRILPSVVSIDTLQKKQTYGHETLIVPSGSGSGVILTKDGVIVTNNHVVEGADLVKVDIPTSLDGSTRPRSLQAKIIGRDPISDIAVVKVDASDLSPAVIASEAPQIGEWAVVAGNPNGYENSISVGVISSLHRTLPADESVLVNTIQTDAPVNPGNSGGALTNSRGEVLGIPTVIATRSGGSEGVSFAIPIARAKRVVDDLCKYGRVNYGWLGASVFDPQVFTIASNLSTLKAAHGTAIPDKGLVIKEIRPGSPAAAAGLLRFDVLLKLDDKVLNQPIDYVSKLMDKRAGDAMRVTYWSKGKTHTVDVKLVELPRQ